MAQARKNTQGCIITTTNNYRIITKIMIICYKHLANLPCLGLSQGGNYNCPWIYRELAMAFSVQQEASKLSSNSLRKGMDAFNLAIKSQNQLIQAIFPRNAELKQLTVTIDDAIYGGARKRGACLNKKGIYEKASISGNAKQKTAQEDVQRGKDEDPVSEDVLKKVILFYEDGVVFLCAEG